MKRLHQVELKSPFIPFPKGETLISPPFIKGGAVVQSRITHGKQSSGTLAPDGGEGLLLFQSTKVLRFCVV
jgi:hypothetical protein